MLLGAVGAVLVGELLLAWFTAGTFDITIWRSFAATVDRVGPIDIYALDGAGLMVYNHPPLAGWWLVVVNALADLGVPLEFTMRALTSLTHALTALLVYAILQPRVGRRWALWSAVAVALSPMLVIISGFHGNNDPIVALFMIASVWLLVDRRRPAWAGFAFSVALSVKIIPFLVLPLLVVVAWRLGRRDLVRLVLGGVPVFLAFWVPVLVFAGRGFVSHVMLYAASGFPRQWGLYQFAHAIGVPQGLLDLYAGPGTYAVLALSALVPAWFVRNTPDRAPAALGLSIAMFLLLSPGFAMQYFAWGAGAIFLVEFWSALAFTVVGGGVWVTLYAQWRGDVRPLTSDQIGVLAIAWFALVPVVVVGLRRLARGQRPSPDARAATALAQGEPGATMAR